jgi:hypothetical protein
LEPKYGFGKGQNPYFNRFIFAYRPSGCGSGRAVGADGGETSVGGTVIGAEVFATGAGFGAAVAGLGAGAAFCFGVSPFASGVAASSFASLGAAGVGAALTAAAATGSDAGVGEGNVIVAVLDASPARGTTGASIGTAAGAPVEVADFFTKDVSIVAGRRFTDASAAMPIESATKRMAKMVVARVKKFDAPRADISPAGLPPPASPPPSDCCIRITPTSAAAMIAWTTRRK